MDEERDQSFDQVSMGSLGAGEKVDKSDLRYDKVMQGIAESSVPRVSYLGKTQKKLTDSKKPMAKTFMRPSLVNNAQITAVIKTNQSYSPVKQWSQVTSITKIKPILAEKVSNKKKHTMSISSIGN